MRHTCTTDFILRSFRRGALLTLWMIIAGCGGGSDAPTAGAATSPTLETTRIASADIGPDGGSVTATSSNGTTYTLVVPQGALDRTVAIQLTPITAVGLSPLNRGLVGAVQMEPSGLTFAGAATLRIGNVRARAANETLVGFGSATDGSSLALKPALVVNGNTEVVVNHFSIAGSSVATAAEVAQLPTAASLSTLDAFRNDLIRAALTDSADQGRYSQEIADVFRRWYVTLVKPRLADAVVRLEATPPSARDVSFFNPGVEAYREWIKTRAWFEEVTEGSTLTNSLLADLDTEARPIVASVVRDEIDTVIAACSRLPLVSLLSLAAHHQNYAVEFVLASTEFGLDNAAFLRKINDCARPVLDAIRLPSPLVIGNPFSLDAQAKMVFNGVPNPVGAPFEFSVTASGATLNQTVGRSNASGRYTTVFTPTADTVEFQVRACLVLRLVDEAGSDICTTQTVSSVVGPEILSGIIGVETAERFEDGSGSSSSFTGFLRVSVSADNQVTVHEATGTRRDSSTTLLSCLDPEPRTFLITSSSTFVATGAIYVMPGPFGQVTQLLSRSGGAFVIRGFFDGALQERSVGGDTSCETRQNVIAGEPAVISILEFRVMDIERDANGRVTAIDLNETFNGGKTVRSGRLTIGN